LIEELKAEVKLSTITFTQGLIQTTTCIQVMFILEQRILWKGTKSSYIKTHKWSRAS